MIQLRKTIAALALATAALGSFVPAASAVTTSGTSVPEAWSPEGRASYASSVPEPWSPEGRNPSGE